MPLLFAGRDIFPLGKVIPDQVRQIDFAPTLLDALGLICLSRFTARALPRLKGESVAETPAHVAASGEMLDGPKNWRVGIRTTEWKYIFAPQNPDIPEELYHLLSDPHERRNLTKSRGTQAEELKRELLRNHCRNLLCQRRYGPVTKCRMMKKASWKSV